MKKSLVLASLLAAFGAASAQSSVTMYGWADLSLGQDKTTTYTAGVANAAVAQTRLRSGDVNGSRLGVRGTEALGGGLNAVFQLESGHSLDTAGLNSTNGGANNTLTNTVFFGRQAFAGLNGGFGSVTLGRQYSSYDSARGAMDVWGHSSFSATGAAWQGNGVDYTYRVNNAIRFDSANYGGFTFSGTYGLGENKTATQAAGNVLALNGGLALGPVKAMVAYQKDANGGVANSGGTTLVAGSNTNENHLLVAGSYNLGFLKLTAEYNTSKDSSNVKDKEFAFGANVPFGASSIDVGFATSKNAATKAASLGFHYNYALSARTSTYIGINTFGKKDVVTGFSTVKSSLFAAGLRHSF